MSRSRNRYGGMRNVALAFGFAWGISAASPTMATTVDFEGFAPGTVHNQGGWTVADSWGNSASLFDEQVMDDGTGNTVWRMSNAVTSGGASNQPFSHTAPQVAGESGSSLWNDFGPDHTTPLNPPDPGANAQTSSFQGSFDFKSATGGPQPGLSLGVSAGAKQSPVRMSLLTMVDNGVNGIDLGFWDVQSGVFVFTPVVSDLSYTEWHRVQMLIDFVDGADNDVVKIMVNGQLVHTGTTWEGYYYDFERIDSSQPRLQAVDSLLFRAASTAQPDTLGAGFFFDNVTVNNITGTTMPVPEPTAVALLGLGGIALLRRRTRQHA